MNKKYAGSLKTQCRSCLEIAPFLYPLEGLLTNCDVSISTMISYCTRNEIDLRDGLPSGVCVQCFRTVRIAYNFIRQYEESQIKLHEEKTSIETNHIKCEIESDEKNSYIENETASEEEEKNGDHESQGSERRVQFEEDQEMSDQRNGCFDESEDYVEQDYRGLESSTVEIEYNSDEAEDDTNDSDLLVEQSETGLYEEEDSTNENDHKVRIIRQDNPPTIQETTIYRMKANTCYTCPLCPNIFFRHFDRGLMRHMAEHKGETFACNSCSESQKEYDSDTFLKHYADVHLYQCHFCKKSFVKRCSLLYHVKTHTNMLYTCRQVACRKVCPSRTALAKHEATHTNAVKHICSECGMNFRTYDTYKYHMNRHDGKKFLCNVCGRTFILSVNLKNHMLEHEGGRPFKCSFCQKTYTSYTPLNKHMRKNHADKKIKNSRYYQYNVNA